MAIRRISDLGKLTTDVVDPVLSNCLLEVSYPKGDSNVVDTNTQYESYYVDAQYLSQNMPQETASKDKPGTVQIGDNIHVDENGRISVLSANYDRWGVVKMPQPQSNSKVGVLGVDEDGRLVDNTAQYQSSQTTETSFSLQTVFDMVYPVGSIYVSMLGTQPPFAGDYGQLVACTWKRIDSDCTLWSTASADLPDSIASTTDPTASQHYVAETLPKLPPMQCVANGAHTHYGKFPAYVLASSHGQYGYAGSPTSSPAYIDKESLKTSSSGSHTHDVSYKTALPAAYQDNASVRPHGFKCSMWVRVS